MKIEDKETVFNEYKPNNISFLFGWKTLSILAPLSSDNSAVIAFPQNGRKKLLEENPVKKCAKELGLAVFQPEKIKDDYKLILHPEIVNEMDNIVIKPLSKNDPAYIFTEACLDKFMETMDESYIDYLTTIHEYYKDYGKELARKASEDTKKALQKELICFTCIIYIFCNFLYNLKILRYWHIQSK